MNLFQYNFPGKFDQNLGRIADNLMSIAKNDLHFETT